MQKADAAKTKWAPSKRFWLYVAGIVLAVLAILSPALFYQPPSAHLELNGRTYKLDIASTEATREKGLGGRESMAADRGMLFEFDQPNKTCFWMKGMHFSLDMVWLDSSRRVIGIAGKVSPKTYPKDFCPAKPAKYVVELNAGTAAKEHINLGQTLKFS